MKPWFRLQFVILPACGGSLLAILISLLAIGPAGAQVCPTLVAQINDPLATQGDNFGWSCSLSGDSLIVGAPYAQAPNGTSDAGRVFTFQRQGGSWTQINDFYAPDYDNSAYFGYSVVVFQNGYVIGARNGLDGVGSAYAFGDQGIIGNTILNPQPAQSDHFGVAVATNGTHIVIGADGDDTFGNIAGATYVFGTTESHDLEATLLPDMAVSFMGISVAMEGDLLLSGAYTDSSVAIANGACFVYRLDEGGLGWMREAKMVPMDPEEYKSFGYSAALSNERALIGAVADGSVAFLGGSAYIFDRQANGTWLQQAKLLPTGAPAGGSLSEFGTSASLDGDLAVVGAIEEDTSNGSAYVFQRQPDGAWLQVARLTAPDGHFGDWFGNSVSISETTVAVGAPRHSFGGHGSAGTVYVFELSCIGPCLGDLNLDGTVDLTDLATQLAHYGETGAPPQDGDLNSDGEVDLTDVATLLTVYGTSCE